MAIFENRRSRTRKGNNMRVHMRERTEHSEHGWKCSSRPKYPRSTRRRGEHFKGRFTVRVAVLIDRHECPLRESLNSQQKARDWNAWNLEQRVILLAVNGLSNRIDCYGSHPTTLTVHLEEEETTESRYLVQ